MDPKPAIAIIQARMSSTRLPGKVLKPLAGKPIIWHIYQRALQCEMVDKVIVATSTERSDDPLAKYCDVNGLNCFRGSLNNVLSRFLTILDSNPHEYFVRITGDCPLIFPRFIDAQISALQKFDGDLVWTPKDSSVLEGQGVQSRRALKYVAAYSENPDDLEHVGSVYIANHPEQFRIVEFNLPSSISAYNFRLTVDEEQDYQLMSKIYQRFKNELPVDLVASLKWLDQNHSVSKINNQVLHKKLNLDLIDKRNRWAALDKVGSVQADLLNN